MSKILVYALIGTGSLILGYGWIQAGYPLLALAALILAPLWWIAIKRDMPRASMIGFITLVVLSAVGVGYKLSFFTALAGVLSGLAAWDMNHFSYSLQTAGVEDNLADLERRHLLQLAAVLLMGGGMAYLSLTAQIRIGFNLAILVALATILGIGALVNWIRKRES